MNKRISGALLLLLAACDGGPGAATGTDAVQRSSAQATENSAPVWVQAPVIKIGSASAARVEFALNEAAAVAWRLEPVFEDTRHDDVVNHFFSKPDIEWSRWANSTPGVDGQQGGVVQTTAVRNSLALPGLLPGTRYVLGMQASDDEGHRQGQITTLEFRTPYGDLPAMAWSTWWPNTYGQRQLGIRSFAMAADSLTLELLDTLKLGETANKPLMLGARGRDRLYMVAGNRLFQIHSHPLTGKLSSEFAVSLPCPVESGEPTADKRHLVLVCAASGDATRLLTVSTGDRTTPPAVQNTLDLTGTPAGNLVLSPQGNRAWLVLQNPSRVQQLRLDAQGGLHDAGSMATTSARLYLSVDPAGHYLYAVDADRRELTHYRADSARTPTAIDAPVLLPCATGAPLFSPDGARAFFPGLVSSDPAAQVDTLTGRLSQIPARSDVTWCGTIPLESRLGPDMRFVSEMINWDRYGPLTWALTALDGEGRRVHLLNPAQKNGVENAPSWWFAGGDVPSSPMVDQTRFAVSLTPERRQLAVWAMDRDTGALRQVSSAWTGPEPTALLVDSGRSMAFVSDAGLNSVGSWSIDSGNGQLAYLSSQNTDAGPVALALEQKWVLDPYEARSIFVVNREARTVQRLGYHKELDNFYVPSTPIPQGFTGISTVWTLPADAEPLTLASVPGTSKIHLTGRNRIPLELDYSTVTDWHSPRTAAPDWPTSAADLAERVSIDPGGRFEWMYEPSAGILRVRHLKALGTSGDNLYRRGGWTDMAMPGLVQAPVIEPSGRFAYTIADRRLDVWAIDRYTGKLSALTSLPLGTTPTRLVVEPEGRFLYVLWSDGGYAALKLSLATGQPVVTKTGTLPLPVAEMAFLAPRPVFSSSAW